MTKNQLIEKLLEATQTALEKEKQSVKTLDECLQDRPASQCINQLKWVERDSGFTNGLLEALEIVRSIKE